MANQNYLIYPNPDFTPTVDRLPDGTLVAYDAVSKFWATFDTGLIFQKNPDATWTPKHLIGCTPIVCKPNRHSQYPLVNHGSHRSPSSVHSIVARAWIGSIPDGWQVDHIDGDIRNASVINLRILPDRLNYRDSGFVAKLRHKKINPTHFSVPFLLRFFDRMADFKRTHSQTQYAHLTHDDLLTMLVSPEFEVCNPT